MNCLSAILSGYFAAGTVPTTLYVGLVDKENYASLDFASDTMSSHTGWQEYTDYAESARPVWTPGSVIDGVPSSVSNPSRPTFTPNDDATVVAAFLTDSPTKGGTSGQLYGPFPFKEGPRDLVSGESFKPLFSLSLNLNTPTGG